MANGNGFWGFLGDVGGGALELGGNVIGFGADVAWGAGQAVYGVGETVYGAGEGIIEFMGSEDGKALANLAGQGYGMYANIQKQKAAARATQKFGGQVVVPYPVGAVGGPSPQGGFQTIGDILIPPGQAAAMAKPVDAIAPEKLMLYAGVGLAAYLLFIA